MLSMLFGLKVSVCGNLLFSASVEVPASQNPAGTIPRPASRESSSTALLTAPQNVNTELILQNANVW